MVLYIKKTGEVISSKHGALFVDGQRICNLVKSRKLRWLSRFRFFSRILRIEPRCIAYIDDDLMLVSMRHKLFVVSQKNGLKDIIESRAGFSHPLTLCSLKSFGRKEIYWGDYGQNEKKEEINIYRYTETGDVRKCYTFPAGEIKHIHNILYDPWRTRFFIFTGDFGEKVGIYEATTDFKAVKPIVLSNEQYRAVQGKVLKKGLLWATDAVMADNHVYFYDFDKKEIKIIVDLNGSVINGLITKEGLLLSTTVEPYPSSPSRIKSLLDYRLGEGIKSREVYVIYVFDDLKVNILKKFKKDIFPMRLCQYGQVFFPYYDEPPTDEVIITPVAVKIFDNKTIKLSMKHTY